ncbi:hypothetical protein OAB57_03585, partial [Bacteriovoracaceae bacterium]|nr:hypothetical protein [Bacteriovoracaceae bacterium]
FLDRSGKEIEMDYADDSLLTGNQEDKPGSKDQEKKKEEKEESEEDKEKKQKDKKERDENVKFTREFACKTMGQMREIKQNIIDVSSIEKYLKTIKTKRQHTIQMDNIEELRKKTSINELTTLTSKEYYTSAGGKLARMAWNYNRRCRYQMSGECYKLLANMKDYHYFNKIIKDNYNVTTGIKARELEVMNPAELRKYLKKQGRFEQEIHLLLQKTDAKKLQAKMGKQFSRERDAFVKMMARKIDDADLNMTKTRDYRSAMSEIPKNPKESENLRKQYYYKLRNDYKLTALIFGFKNIIEGYMPRTDPSGRRVTDPGSAKREIKHSYFDPKFKKRLVIKDPDDKSAIDAGKWRLIQGQTEKKY